MRTGGWILLFLSFVTGIITARSIACFLLNPEPVEVVYQGPTVKILVAQKEIPLGTEITAEYVAFKDVPVNEIPEQAIVDFMQVYRRRPAYLLIAGCPICEDLLLQKNAADSTAEYLPAGSQIVSLEIGHLRVGDNVMEIGKPLTHFLTAGGKVDIRCVPQQTETGEFIRLKNLVIDKYSSLENSSETVNECGKVVLENVAVHHLNVKKASAGGKKIQNISLLLENGQAEKLAAAAREGRLRIVPRQTEQPEQAKEITAMETAESTDSQKPALTLTAELYPAELRTETQETATSALIPSVVMSDTVLKQPVRLLDSAAVSVPEYAETEIAVSKNVIEKNNSVEHRSEISFAVPKSVIKPEEERVCNDSAAVSLSVPAVKTASMTSAAVKVSNPAASNKMFGVQKGVEVGLPAMQQSGYSPFFHSAKQQIAETAEGLSEPLPLKTRVR